MLLVPDGDRAIVHGKHPLLTKPLKKGSKTEVRRGVLRHDSIIGQRVRDLIQAHKGVLHWINPGLGCWKEEQSMANFCHLLGPEYRLSHPSLDEYVALTPRLVTPVSLAKLRAKDRTVPLFNALLVDLLGRCQSYCLATRYSRHAASSRGGRRTRITKAIGDSGVWNWSWIFDVAPGACYSSRKLSPTSATVKIPDPVPAESTNAARRG